MKKMKIEMNNLYKRSRRAAPRVRRCKKGKIDDHINRLPDEILGEIFNGISEAKHLFNLSMVSKRFASLIPYHSSSTITLQLPHLDSLVSKKIFRRYKFIASFKKFINKFRFTHTLHLKLTREYYNVDIVFEFMPNNKPPQILILSAIIPGMENSVRNLYYPLFNNTNTTYYFTPLFPGYHACGRWEAPLLILLSDSKVEEQPWMNEYEAKLSLPKSGSVVKNRVMLSVTSAAWGDDGVFFRNNTRGKDVALLEAVRRVMNFYP